MNYLALGDSYTVGESIFTKDSFPFQLETLFLNHNITTESIKVIAQTGWTSDELLAGINKAEFNCIYDLITICIGVNNQYRSYQISQFEVDLNTILDICEQLISQNGRIVLVSIPDYGITQYGKKNGDPRTISKDILEYNACIKSIGRQRGHHYVDIYEHSKLAEIDHLLIAKDGLHPSKIMYKYWAEKIFEKLK